MIFKSIVVVLIIGFVGLVAISQLNKSTGDKDIKNTLVADRSNYDFGTISMKDGNVRHTYTVQNTGTEPVTINKLSTSCMCTKASLTVGGKTVGPFSMDGMGEAIPKIDVSIPAGEKGEVEAVYDPTAHGSAGIGNIERSVFLDSSTGARTELTFKTTVKP